jgi:hypothetical protein
LGDHRIRAIQAELGRLMCSMAPYGRSIQIAATPSSDGLGRRIKQVQYKHHRALDARLAAVGTTLAQWAALRAIGRLPGASAHALAVETFQSDQAFGTWPTGSRRRA